MTVSDSRRLKELEAENSKLKKLLTESEVDKAALKASPGPMVSPQVKRQAVGGCAAARAAVVASVPTTGGLMDARRHCADRVLLIYTLMC